MSPQQYEHQLRQRARAAETTCPSNRVTSSNPPIDSVRRCRYSPVKLNKRTSRGILLDCPLAPDISSVDLARLLCVRPEAELLDIRTRREFDAEHIYGSRNTPLDAHGEASPVLQSVAADGIVMGCRSGQRAQTACTALIAAGRTELSVLDGGMLDWSATGHFVARAG